MAFVKIVKNKAYHKRMQVKPKRRRQGKTDYYARRRLVMQAKNKYDSKKYRLVVRRTNSRIICQVIYSTMDHDHVMCSADSNELKHHGLTAGLTNYPAAYCTGLLLARRLLKQVGLDSTYKGAEKIDGAYFNADENLDDNKRPFKALLDVGIQRTTTGARVFGALKGACDGGVNVPHNTKRFPGFSRGKIEEVVNKRGKTTGDKEKTKDAFVAENHRTRIMGTHITEYMNALKKEDATKFKRQFCNWEKCLTAAKAKTCEDLYKAVHKAINANPDRKKAAGNAKPTRTVTVKGPERVMKDSKGRTWMRNFKTTYAEKKAKVDKRMADALKRLQDN